MRIVPLGTGVDSMVSNKVTARNRIGRDVGVVLQNSGAVELSRNPGCQDQGRGGSCQGDGQGWCTGERQKAGVPKGERQVLPARSGWNGFVGEFDYFGSSSFEVC